MLTVPLLTPRLRIDRLTVADAAAMAAYRDDADVARWQSWTCPYTVERAAAAIAAMAGDEPGVPGHQVNLALRGADGVGIGLGLVGDVYVHVLAAAPHTVELGITLAPAAHGRGLATEAIAAVVDALFGAGDVLKAVAYVDTRNAPSLALFDRLGFRREGHLAHSFRADDGTLADEILFGLTADVWRRRVDEPTVTFAPHPADVVRAHEELYAFNVEATGIGDGLEWAAFVRDDLGRLAGAVTGTLWGDVAEVHVLWVAGHRRGAGVGTRLLDAAEAAVRARGARRVVLATHTFQAVTFYERRGFERAGAWRQYPRGHDDVFLQKELG